MARVQIGMIVERDGDGNFTNKKRPIYREVPVGPSGLTAEEEKRLGDFAVGLERQFHDVFAQLAKIKTVT